MPACEAHIATDRAERYLQQLCSHLVSMRHLHHGRMSGHSAGAMPSVEHVEQSADRAVIRFAEGSWLLEAGHDGLRLRVEAGQPADLERLKSAITARITKIGRRDRLSVTWAQAG